LKLIAVLEPGNQQVVNYIFYIFIL